MCTTNVWRLVESGGAVPEPRKNHSAVLVYSKLVIFGGVGVGEDGAVRRFNDVWSLDTDTMTWTRLDVQGDIPCGRDGHTMSAIGTKLYMFGGWTGPPGADGDAGESYKNDLYVLDIKSLVWQRQHLSGSAPSPRKLHTATVVEADQRIIIIGGYSIDRRVNDVHVIDLKNSHYNQPEVKGNLPQIRSAHTAVLIERSIFVFGGFGKGNVALNDFRSLDIGFFRWSLPAIGGREPDLTQARGGHGVAVIGSQVIHFGGSAGRKCHDNMIVLDTESELNRMRKRYAFMREHYPGIFESFKVASSHGVPQCRWRSGLPFISELPFTHEIANPTTDASGKIANKSSGEKLFLLADWSRFRFDTTFRLEQHPSFANVFLVL